MYLYCISSLANHQNPHVWDSVALFTVQEDKPIRQSYRVAHLPFYFFLLFSFLFVPSTCSVCLECPQRSGTDLREDITTLIKFWQAIFQDKKSLQAIFNMQSKQRSVSMSSDIGVYSVSLPALCPSVASSYKRPLDCVFSFIRVWMVYISFHASKNGWILCPYQHQFNIQVVTPPVQRPETNALIRSILWWRILCEDEIWSWRWWNERSSSFQRGTTRQPMQTSCFLERNSWQNGQRKLPLQRRFGEILSNWPGIFHLLLLFICVQGWYMQIFPWRHISTTLWLVAYLRAKKSLGQAK